MLVNKSLETPQGTVVFEGELEQRELDLVLKVGLNFLLQMGALPIITKTEEGLADLNMEDATKQ
jgi:hypothetical protein